MKKKFILLLLCFTSIYGVAQKEFTSENFSTETVDEFGDKTGINRTGIIAQGHFSNSATTNSCALLMLYVDGNAKIVESMFFEYCSNHPSNDNYYLVFIGTSTKEKFVTTSDWTRIEKFTNMCLNNDTINVKLIEDGTYATTRGYFRLYNCKQFVDLYLKNI